MPLRRSPRGKPLSPDSAIRGKVAKILTDRMLIINRGEADGVKAGMRFAVLDPRTDDIQDPDTGESLGSIPLVKVRVEAYRVGDRATIARTYESFTYGMSNLADLFKSRTEYTTLRATGGREDLEPEESFVKIGDPVVELPRAKATQKESPSAK